VWGNTGNSGTGSHYELAFYALCSRLSLCAIGSSVCHLGKLARAGSANLALDAYAITALAVRFQCGLDRCGLSSSIVVHILGGIATAKMDNDLVVTERAARITWALAEGARLTTREVAERSNFQVRSAYYMMLKLARVLPIALDDCGRWCRADLLLIHRVRESPAR